MGNRDVIAESAFGEGMACCGPGSGDSVRVPLRDESETYWCAGLLPDFGGPKGTIIACKFTLDDIFDVADAGGFYHSGLSPKRARRTNVRRGRRRAGKTSMLRGEIL